METTPDAYRDQIEARMEKMWEECEEERK